MRYGMVKVKVTQVMSQLFATQWTPLFTEFSRLEHWSGQPFPSPGDLPNPGIKPRSPTSQVDSLPAEPQGSPRIPKWVAFPSPGDLPNPGIESRSPTLQVDSLPVEPQGKPNNTEVGSLSFLQWIFLTQKLNQSLLHCR